METTTNMRPSLTTGRPEIQAAKAMLDEMETGRLATYEVSDYAINTLREAADLSGWTQQELGQMLMEEVARAKGLAPTHAGMLEYFKVRRVGSQFRLTRSARAMVFCQLAARGAL